MKKFVKKTLCLLLIAVLTLSLFACTQPGGQETTKPVNKVPATQPSFDETTTPIYTRPGDEDDPDATADDALDAPGVGGDPLEGEQGDASNYSASGDKPDLLLPAPQRALLDVLEKTGKPLVTVLAVGSAINAAAGNAQIVAWYPGQAGGTALQKIQKLDIAR